jgi:hypothetical protein
MTVLISPWWQPRSSGDLPSLGEEEDFRLRHCLRDIREKLGVGFLSGRRFYEKEGQSGPHHSDRKLDHMVDLIFLLPFANLPPNVEEL